MMFVHAFPTRNIWVPTVYIVLVGRPYVMVDSVSCLRYAECSRAPDYITIGFLGRWGTYACPQCLPSGTVPIRSWTWTLWPPGIHHRHLPYHTIPYHGMLQPENMSLASTWGQCVLWRTGLSEKFACGALACAGTLAKCGHVHNDTIVHLDDNPRPPPAPIQRLDSSFPPVASAKFTLPASSAVASGVRGSSAFLFRFQSPDQHDEKDKNQSYCNCTCNPQ